MKITNNNNNNIPYTLQKRINWNEININIAYL